MALYIITNKTIKMANNGKGIGPRGLGAPKSMAKYGSMAKQTEPKDGKPVMVHNRFKGNKKFTSPNTGLTVDIDTYTQTSDSIPRNNVRNIFKAAKDSKGFRDYVETEYPHSVDPKHKPSSSKQAKKPTEPKTGKAKNTSGVFGNDSIMGDENNDGNMVTRAVSSFRRGSQRSDEQALRAKNTQQTINNKFKRDIKQKGFIQAVKSNFKF
tara:strand:- start:237 stop:866 length:630 start_codon:yes stop_codon:yes gene_type:complete